eukprot:TRINITY_DN38099_c0_g1_i1.p1 TRINITY_DN38099_c0_g1~~TRINITY_DN38099_c0_g1_i1.p1  ORF type:complete len:1238 (+),score=118.50 TRINITY_DN38099_c0_g1_i1:25-3714(+)
MDAVSASHTDAEVPLVSSKCVEVRSQRSVCRQLGLGVEAVKAAKSIPPGARTPEALDTLGKLVRASERFFTELSKECVEDLCQNLEYVQASAGTALSSEGSSPTYLHVIAVGQVRLARYAQDDRCTDLSDDGVKPPEQSYTFLDLEEVGAESIDPVARPTRVSRIFRRHSAIARKPCETISKVQPTTTRRAEDARSEEIPVRERIAAACRSAGKSTESRAVADLFTTARSSGADENTKARTSQLGRIGGRVSKLQLQADVMERRKSEIEGICRSNRLDRPMREFLAMLVGEDPLSLGESVVSSPSCSAAASEVQNLASATSSSGTKMFAARGSFSSLAEEPAIVEEDGIEEALEDPDVAIEQQREPLATTLLGMGRFLGLHAILEGLTYDAVASAVSDCELLRISVGTLLEIFARERRRRAREREQIFSKMSGSDREQTRLNKGATFFQSARHRRGTVLCMQGDVREPGSESDRLLVLVSGRARAVREYRPPASSKPQKSRLSTLKLGCNPRSVTQRDVAYISPGGAINDISQVLGREEPCTIIVESAEAVVMSVANADYCKYVTSGAAEALRITAEQWLAYVLERIEKLDGSMEAYVAQCKNMTPRESSKRPAANSSVNQELPFTVDTETSESYSEPRHDALEILEARRVRGVDRRSTPSDPSIRREPGRHEAFRGRAGGAPADSLDHIAGTSLLSVARENSDGGFRVSPSSQHHEDCSILRERYSGASDSFGGYQGDSPRVDNDVTSQPTMRGSPDDTCLSDEDLAWSFPASPGQSTQRLPPLQREGTPISMEQTPRVDAPSATPPLQQSPRGDSDMDSQCSTTVIQSPRSSRPASRALVGAGSDGATRLDELPRLAETDRMSESTRAASSKGMSRLRPESTTIGPILRLEMRGSDFEVMTVGLIDPMRVSSLASTRDTPKPDTPAGSVCSDSRRPTTAPAADGRILSTLRGRRTLAPMTPLWRRRWSNLSGSMTCSQRSTANAADTHDRHRSLFSSQNAAAQGRERRGSANSSSAFDAIEPVDITGSRPAPAEPVHVETIQNTVDLTNTMEEAPVPSRSQLDQLSAAFGLVHALPPTTTMLPDGWAFDSLANASTALDDMSNLDHMCSVMSSQADSWLVDGSRVLSSTSDEKKSVRQQRCTPNQNRKIVLGPQRTRRREAPACVTARVAPLLRVHGIDHFLDKTPLGSRPPARVRAARLRAAAEAAAAEAAAAAADNEPEDDPEME